MIGVEVGEEVGSTAGNNPIAERIHGERSTYESNTEHSNMEVGSTSGNNPIAERIHYELNKSNMEYL